MFCWIVQTFSHHILSKDMGTHHYMDNWLLLAVSCRSTEHHTQILFSEVVKEGFLIRAKNSILTPKQCIIHLVVVFQHVSQLGSLICVTDSLTLVSYCTNDFVLFWEYRHLSNSSFLWDGHTWDPSGCLYVTYELWTAIPWNSSVSLFRINIFLS